jgi:hypothetical protein
MRNLVRRSVLACGVVLIATSASMSAWAQANVVRIRGAIEAVDGNNLTIKSRSGESLKVKLDDKPLYVAMVKATLGDIKAGTFIGTTAMPGATDSDPLKAVEVHIFPEAMRGTGEGHRPWDLKPKSTMTNANVENTVKGVDGQTLTLKYKDGEKKVVVTPETAIVTYATGDAAEVKPGANVIIFATKQADGSLTAPRVTYGRNGLVPPM